MKRTNRIHETTSDRIFNFVIHFILIVVLIIIIYPLYFVLVASFSDPSYVNSGALLLFPKGFTLMGYKRVFSDSRLLMCYGNTILYTVCGTALGLVCSLLCGYALAQKKLPFRNIIMGVLVFTMYFNGGLIPTYLLVSSLHLVNTRAVVIILGSISVYNIILIRSYYMSTVPAELYDAAQIDGCGCARMFVSIALPLSKAIAAVIALYLAVGYWNSYFTPMIYLSDAKKAPLAILLREILISGTSNLDTDTSGYDNFSAYSEAVKYATIIASTIPVLCIYPFLQRFFVKGVMLGAIKG